MDATMKIAIVLSAYDRMSRVVDDATNKAQAKLASLTKSKLFEGGALMAAGAGIVASMTPAVKAYSKLEDANIELQSSMMNSAGAIDDNFSKVATLAEELGNKLPGATADFDAMFQVMMNNGVKSTNILNGVGKAASYLAVDLKMPYEAAGEFAARMKEATGVADQEMLSFMDTISRAKNMGLNVDEMRYAFGRSAGTLKNLGLQGLKASNDMAVLYTSLIRAGMSGETAGTSFNSLITNILDRKHFSKFQALGKQYGVAFNFFKDGKFLGVENMIAQFDKLKGLDTVTKGRFISVLTGGGQDGQVLSNLINGGVAGYQKLRAEMEAKASLNDKVNLKLQTLSALWEATTGTIENMLAALGAGLAPVLKPIAEMIGIVAGKIKEWLSANPALAQFISMLVSLVGIAVMIAGVIKIVQGIRIAFMLLNLTMAANPFILIAAAAIVAISLIYANWGKISAWFKQTWEKVKQVFSSFWNWAKNMFLNYTPHGLIIKHWDKIGPSFGKIWNSVKTVFLGFVRWFVNLHLMFFNAGRNIVKSIWEGIKGFVNKPIEAIKGMVQKIRNLLPFSPAKDGPLRDIHRIKLVETIAQSIKPTSMVNAMRKVAGAAFNIVARPTGLTPVAGGSGSAVINNNFNFTLTGGATKQDANLIMSEIEKRLPQLMRNYENQRTRISFGG